ncbi:MAG TPA: hypothetical protein VIV61_01740 [Candidatus Ozemobacteraceae bacterium]
MKQHLLLVPLLLAALAFGAPDTAMAGAYDQLIEIGGQPGNVPEPPPPTPVEPQPSYDDSSSSDSGSSSSSDSSSSSGSYSGSSDTSSGYESSSDSSGGTGYSSSGSSSQNSGTGTGVPFQGFFNLFKPKPVDHVKKAAEIGSRADRAYERGNYRDAVKFYKRALKHTPLDAELLRKLQRAESSLAASRADREREERNRRRQREAAQKKPSPPPLPPQLRPSPPQPRPVPVITAQPDPFVSATQTRSTLRDIKSRIDALRKAGLLQNVDTLLAKYAATWAQAIIRDDLTEKDRESLQLDIPIRERDENGRKPLSLGRDDTPTTPQEPYYGENKDLEQMLSRFNAERAAAGAEMLGERTVGNLVPEPIATQYENVLGLGKVTVELRSGNTAGAVKEGIDFVIGKLGMPQASFAVDGGRIYANTAFTALNKFMEDSTRAVGGTFDRKAFWESLRGQMSAGQKCVMEWIGGPGGKE